MYFHTWSVANLDVSLKGSVELKSIVTRVALFESHEHKKRVPHLFLLQPPLYLWDRVTEAEGQHTWTGSLPSQVPRPSWGTGLVPA